MANPEYVSALRQMGFTEHQAQVALVNTQNKGVDDAIEWILMNADESNASFPMSHNEMEVEDKDYLLALKLQQEEEKIKDQTQKITCQLTQKPVPVSNIYITDECSHKFDRAALVKYINEVIFTHVTVVCPVVGCGAPLSLRDMKELLPETPKPSGSFLPFSSSKQATQRISNELQHILKSNPKSQGFSVQPVHDNLYLWELKFFNFDPKDLLAQDLHKMRKDHILLQIAFPPTYPLNPPFVRVIRPRFAFRTGHVTVGGSVCTELLTNKGWTPANTIESVIVSVRAQFMEGGARLDFSNTRDYTEAEAKEAFNRMVQTHGWH